MDQADRRPLNSRGWRVSHVLTRWLAARGVTPNSISTFGMLMGIAAGGALVATRYTDWSMVCFLVAAACIQLRLTCNLLDGMVAEVQKSYSPVGALYNEIPDRVSDAATLIGAGYAIGGHVILGYVAACLAIFIAYIRVQGRVAGAPQDFSGPMAKPQRMFAATVGCLIAGVLPAAYQPRSEQFPGLSTMSLMLAIVVAGECVTVVRRIYRIGSALQQGGKREI